MGGWQAALWALLGSGVAEAVNLSASMRPVGPRRRWRWPWSARADRPMVMVAVGLRLFVGCGLAAPLGASGQLPTPFSAFLAGLAAPLIVARIFQAIPVADAEPVATDSSHPGHPSSAHQVVGGDRESSLLEDGISDAAG
jgi:hypothetical protein